MCRDEGHAMRAEVCVKVRGFVEAPAAHPAAHPSLPLLARFRRGRRTVLRRCARRCVSTTTVLLTLAQAVRDEFVSAERAGRGETGSALQALLRRVLRITVDGNVALELFPILGGEAAGRATECAVVFLLLDRSVFRRSSSLRWTRGVLSRDVIRIGAAPSSWSSALIVKLR